MINTVYLKEEFIFLVYFTQFSKPLQKTFLAMKLLCVQENPPQNVPYSIE